MTVTPKVYRFSPGAKTGVAVIDGVKRCMDATGTHHWEVVAYSAGSTITLRDKATLQRQLRLVALATGSPSPSVACYYSAAAGANETPACFITGGLLTLALNDSQASIGTDESYVVEVEDSFSLCLGKGTDGGPGVATGSFNFALHAGRIFSAHNRSDSSLEEGILAGGFGVRAVTTGSETNRYLGAAITSATHGIRQSLILLPDNTWSRVSGATNVSANGFRGPSQASTLIANVGDNNTIERLVPMVVSAAVSTTPGGHVAYTRYIRGRRYSIGGIGPDGLTIVNGQVLASAGDPANIGWRHNTASTDGNDLLNLLHVWCPSGQEVLVD